MNSCACWYEYCIEYTGNTWSELISNKVLETFLIDQTPSVSSLSHLTIMIRTFLRKSPKTKIKAAADQLVVGLYVATVSTSW